MRVLPCIRKGYGVIAAIGRGGLLPGGLTNLGSGGGSCSWDRYWLLPGPATQPRATFSVLLAVILVLCARRSVLGMHRAQSSGNWA